MSSYWGHLHPGQSSPVDQGLPASYGIWRYFILSLYFLFACMEGSHARGDVLSGSEQLELILQKDSCLSMIITAEGKSSLDENDFQAAGIDSYLCETYYASILLKHR